MIFVVGHGAVALSNQLTYRLAGLVWCVDGTTITTDLPRPTKKDQGGAAPGRPRSTWRDGAFAALRPVLTSPLVGWGWYGVAQDRAQWRALCDSV
eukprot:365252-Chlamydomonas_euryale.AAC.17